MQQISATGAAPCVGTLGPTLGGGIGTLQGIRGLTLDSLVSVQLVTAKGELVTASKTENTELFWGIRGAGYNFGIVTEATYKVYDATNGGQVMNGDFKFPASANRSFFEIMKKFDHALPAELSFSTIISFNRTINKVGKISVQYFKYSNRILLLRC
jgi:FAD/FMN-containing dehydrogenase